MRTTPHSGPLFARVKVFLQPEKSSKLECPPRPRIWSKNRFQTCKPDLPTTQPTILSFMAATLPTTMLNAFSKLFAHKAPTTEIAGAELTHDEAIQLMHTCNALKYAFNLQLDAIGKLPRVPNEQINSRVRLIQTRHTDIQIHLVSIIFKTRYSTVPWIHEFADARLALEGKIVSINRRSRKLGWIVTARQCWPGIAETYAWLLPLVIRLQSELRHALKQKELWTTDIPLQACGGIDPQQEELATLYTEYPRVLFEKEVMVREYQVGGIVGVKDGIEAYSVRLADDRKKTADRFKYTREEYGASIDRLSDSSL